MLAPLHADFFRRTTYPFSTKGVNHHGELLLNLLGFALVALLGFMPLIVIHWADRRPHVHLTQLTPRRMTNFTAHTGLLVMLSDWLAYLAL